MRTCFFLLFLTACSVHQAYAQPLKQVCIKGACVTAETADNEVQRMQGLMYRDSLAPDRGMLFVFEKEARYSFWMMNMRFAIDIIWFDKNFKIIDIKKNAQPCGSTCDSILPQGAASYVLEVVEGFSGKHAISIGDTVTIRSLPSQ
jgi:uncharacterized protein